MSQFQQDFIATVIEHYGLELDDYQVDSIMVAWVQTYDTAWIFKAIVESLYRGRYKVKSVDNILKDWQRMGEPRYQYTPDYEREILQKLPARPELPGTILLPTVKSPSPIQPSELPVIDHPILHHTEHLDPEESAPFRYHACSLRDDLRSSTPPNQSGTQHVSIIMEGSETDSLAAQILPLLPSEVDTSSNGKTVKPNRIVASQSNLLLYNRLKSIVDPNQRQKLNPQNSVEPLSIDLASS